ncbi:MULTISPECIES: hypothetical protein [unclassified Streptomyces]|uniref:hypothetical protein n=1 Tax=unclassified Streptomyces TaxID=2593676 RepID=UPI003D7594F2
MAHAAPAPGRPPARTGRPGPPARRSGTPDVFDERVHRVAWWVSAVALGLIYGYWAAANRRSGGPITGWNLLFGFVTAAVFMLLFLAVHVVAPRLRRELHALLWTAFTGCAFGFLYSQSGASVLRSAVMSLAVAAAAFAVMFYRYYTHEDAEGHRIR